MELQYKQQLLEVLSALIEPIASGAQYDVAKEGDQWRVNVVTADDENLLGEHGETVRAVQHVARVIMHQKYPQNRTHFMIDVGEYRKMREKLIKSKIAMLARYEIIEHGNTVIMLGLNGYERKLIHGILADISGLETTSIGSNDSRKLIIRPTSEVGSKGIDQAKMFELKDLEAREYNG